MVLASFQVNNKLDWFRFFQETFLVTNTSVAVILGMLFLILSNVDMLFLEQELFWRSYTSAEALSTTKQVKIINKKELAKAALDENVETFVVHLASLISMITIYLACEV